MEVPPTALHLPSTLPFPLTIHRLHSKPDAQVQKTQAILTYSFLPVRPDADGKRERVVESWDSPVQGSLVKWDVKEGQVLQDSAKPVVYVREPCTHEVQWDGMCAVCGKDLTAVDYTGFSDTARATISMVHDVGGLTVSLSEAHRLESATTQRLLANKKLSLIVDLDQTIVHATVDPTVGEWLKDPSNPNFGALKGVGRFKLGDEVGYKKPKKKQPKASEGTTTDNGTEKDLPGLADEAVGGEEQGSLDAGEEEEDDGCWYYIKMRPGLAAFLQKISEIYEMHVYTMGTRAYAIEVCKVIDPTGALFGGRILSRDESGSMTRKSLQRLFPCDTNMVVIIDDRADVWDGSPNLVKVIPYEFFVGIGDINAAFLPKKKELVPPPVKSSEDSSALSSSATSGSPRSSSSSEINGEGSMRESVTTAPSTSSSTEAGEKASTLALHPHHHETIEDLLVTPSPASIVSPALSDTSVTLAHAHDIESQISDRPLQRIADQTHAQQQHERQTNSKSPTPPSLSTRAGDLQVSEGMESSIEDCPVSTGDYNIQETDAGPDVEEDVVDEAVLRDDDTELERVYKILEDVHTSFYREQDEVGTSDVSLIIPSMKRSTLKDCQLVFSGLVALGTRPEDSEYWRLAETFGATCGNALKDEVTHLVANQAGTAKVHSARRNPGIKIVYPQWLLDSVAHWAKMDEEAYLLPAPKPVITSDEVPTPVEPEPDSPVRPELSDGEGERGGDEDVELDMAEIDWGEAMAEMDDLLNETDDDATDRDDDGAASTSNGNSRPKKRSRPSAASTDDESDPGGGYRSTSIASSSNGSSVTESPLQKRVKTARSRSSGLRTSLSAAALATASGSTPTSLKAPSGKDPQEVIDAAIAQAEQSQASSSVSSDDEGFLASLEAELEAGFGEGGEEGEEEDATLS